MKNIGIWLYRYMTMHVDHILAMLDAMLSDPVPRPALQRVRTSVSPRCPFHKFATSDAGDRL